MNLFFDEDSQKVLVDAKWEMHDLKHPYVGSEHLLLAILKNAELDITKFLNEYGITYDIFRKELINIIGVGTKSNEWFLFTPLLKRIINNATYSSKDNNKCVSPHNLFAAILQEGEGVANRILFGMNVDLEALYDKFLNSNCVSLSVKKSLLLDEFAINMNEECKNNKYDPVVGREDEINRIIQILMRKNKNNPILLGEAGVGKTAIVEEVARMICNKDVPYKLKNVTIYNIPMSNLIAGTKYRGEFEERLTKIIEEVKGNQNIILFIDEIHTLVGAGGAEGAIDASNIFKPFLARGDIKVIGATTLDEYAKYIEKDKALERRFQKVYVEEPSMDKVRDIIDKLLPIYEKFHSVKFDNSLVELMIKLSDKYIVRGKQPDKTIDFLDEVCCFATINNSKSNYFINDLENKINFVEEKKNSEILNHNFKEALKLREKEYSLKDKYNKMIMNDESELKVTNVTEDDLYSVLYNKTSIPLNKILRKKIKGLEGRLKKEVYGQDNVIKEIVNILSNTALIDKKDIFSYLFVGKKCVGKSFLAEKISMELFGKSSIIKINMSEFNQDTSITKLLGAAPGYVGYDDKGSYLDKIKSKSFSVVILENIDKCNKKISNIFKNAFKNGYFTNSKGEMISITNCIFFMTAATVDKNIGFLDDLHCENDFDITYSNIIKLNDITEKVIDKYLNDKIVEYRLENLSNKEEIIKKIKDESNYKEEGFSKIQYLIDKYFVFSYNK